MGIPVGRVQLMADDWFKDRIGIDSVIKVLRAGPKYTDLPEGERVVAWLKSHKLPAEAEKLEQKLAGPEKLPPLEAGDGEDLRALLKAFSARIYNLAVKIYWATHPPDSASKAWNTRSEALRQILLQNSVFPGPEGEFTKDQLVVVLYDGKTRQELLPILDTPVEPIAFEQLLEQELEEIQQSRQERNVETVTVSGGHVFARAHSAQLIGLALSGGGIRSATFNLGVLQALSEMGLLPSVDYLSTVSGGGYIGSWLAAWLRRRGPAPVAKGLRTDKSADPADEARGPIQTLRKYSSYLAPARGLLSADIWTAVTIWIRNTALNLIILLSALTFLLAIPRCAMYLSGLLHGWNIHSRWTWFTLFISGALVNVFLLRNLRFFSCRSDDQKPRTRREDHVPFPAREEGILVLILAPCFVCAATIAAMCWTHPNVISANSWHRIPVLPLVGSFIYYLLTGWIGGFPECFKSRTSRGTAAAACLLSFLALASTVLTTTLLWLAAGLFSAWNTLSQDAFERWTMLAWGMPIVIAVFVSGAFLYMGLLGVDFPDQRREWCSRLAAWLGMFVIGWSVLFGTAIYGPWLVSFLTKLASGWIASTLTVGWVATTVGGLLAGKSPNTGQRDSSGWLSILAKVAPVVFIAGLLLVLSTGLEIVSARIGSPLKLCDLGAIYAHSGLIQALGVLQDQHWALLDSGAGLSSLWILLTTAALAGFFAWRFDVNEFSMHHFYRNRLVRCYLGASTVDRHANAFTGLDAQDDVALTRMTPSLQDLESATHYSGPYPIINAALNLVTGENLAWQERKASSFVFTPRYCGYEISRSGTATHLPQSKKSTQGLADHAFCPTAEYAYPPVGVHVGTAMAISGAAASPNWGYHSSPSVAFLLTIFNVRLGWWLGNPRHPKAWKKSGPGMGLLYLLFELTGRSNDRRGYVYLSDGGHFENLGIYELVRRRCRFIIASDADEDAAFSFEDLGNAIRKCRDDFGIEIEIDVERIRAQRGQKSQWHCAIGTIHYERVDEHGSRGILLYLKSSLTGDEPTDVLEYASRAPEFPHQTTLNQFFEESIFESYRKLGYHIAESTFLSTVKSARAKSEQPLDNKEGFFFALTQTWFPPSASVEKSFTKHADALSRLSENLRSDNRLRFLDRQIYPEWNDLMKHVSEEKPSRVTELVKVFSPPPRRTQSGTLWLPETYEEIQSGFHFCCSVIQLMENVYLDLNLENEFSHPDNRGWINLFHHWSWSGMLRVTWAITANTYGARFQKFCERYLKLTMGHIRVSNTRGGLECFNFLETKLISALLNQNGKSLKDVNIFALSLSVWNQFDEIEYELNPKSEQVSTAKESFEFTFGFAVAVEDQLIAFRLQDHLRGLDLARQSMVELLNKCTAITHMELWEYPDNFCDVTSEEDRDTKQFLFDSALYQVQKSRSNA